MQPRFDRPMQPTSEEITPVLSIDEFGRACDILTECSMQAAKQLNKRTFQTYWQWRRGLEKALSLIVYRHCALILGASKHTGPIGISSSTGVSISLPSYAKEPIPPPAFKAAECAGNVPKTAGVYFVWDCDGILAYVGKSRKLNRRVKLSSHSHIRMRDSVSWLEVDLWQLSHAEAFFIGMLQPYRNGGKSALGIEENDLVPSICHRTFFVGAEMAA